jgi:hypothetical protein
MRLGSVREFSKGAAHTHPGKDQCRSYQHEGDAKWRASLRGAYPMEGHPQDEKARHSQYVEAEDDVLGEHVLSEIAVACFGTLREFLVLKGDIGQMFSDGEGRCIVRQAAHAGRLPAIILAGHRWKFGRRGFHGGAK